MPTAVVKQEIRIFSLFFFEKHDFMQHKSRETSAQTGFQVSAEFFGEILNISNKSEKIIVNINLQNFW